MDARDIKRLETILGKLETLQHRVRNPSQRFRDNTTQAKTLLLEVLSDAEKSREARQ